MYCVAKRESNSHIFLNCSFARKICSHFTMGLNIHWVIPENTMGLFSLWGGEGGLGKRSFSGCNCLRYFLGNLEGKESENF